MAAGVEPSESDDQTVPPATDPAITDAVIDRWPIGPRSASEALRRRYSMSLPGILLLAIVAPICLAMAIYPLVLPSSVQEASEIAPTISYILILIAVVISFEVTRQSLRRRRAIRVGRRLLEVGTAICPGCGSDPFDPGGCCRRAPVGWSPLDLYGFWHEATVQRAKPVARLVRRAGNLGLPFGLFSDSRRDRHGDADFLTAWRRPRGPYGTSLRLPRANPAAKAMRSIGRWWPVLSPLWFVLLAIVLLPPVLSLSAGGLSTMGWIFLGIVVIGGVWGLVAFLRRVRDRSESGRLTAPRCNACRYRLHPPFPDACPECGVQILTAQDVTLIPYRVE